MKSNMYKKILLFLIAGITILNAQDNDKPLLLGVDRLIKEEFLSLSGKNVVLFTNQSAHTSGNIPTADIFIEQGLFKFNAILTPEHGYYTTIPAGETVMDEVYKGKKVISLYGLSKELPDFLNSIADIVVVDIQDVGIRSYTYISTLFNLMKKCAQSDIPVLILDRPNPLGGVVVDGGLPDPGLKSFVCMIPVTYLHGCTIGEIAKMINDEGWLDDKANLKCELSVLEMAGWERWMNWEDTGLSWFPTSPHVPSVDAVRGMAMLGAFGELGIISIGIGTTSPFQYIGSPWLPQSPLIKLPEKLKFKGIDLIPTKYSPLYGMYSGKECTGYLLKFSPDNLTMHYSYGMELLYELSRIDTNLFKKENIKEKSENMFKKVTGSKSLLDMYIKGASFDMIINEARKGLGEYLLLRKKYLLY